MYSIGYDIGSSSIKAALVDLATGDCVATAQYPETEMAMITHQVGWAEQHPEQWWDAVCNTTRSLLHSTSISGNDIVTIGIAYQMHGLVLVDDDHEVLRPSIIWCDSRAVELGNLASKNLGNQYCHGHLLNSPGNFTASKLKWIQENEPRVYDKIYKAMLPGDYIAMKFSNVCNTTISGLSEGIFWDFAEHEISNKLLDYYQISQELIPDIVDTLAVQGVVSIKAAEETGLRTGTKITFRAGDQPNNALSLNVLESGEVAATGGTSGVVYGVSNEIVSDPKSRINGFAHVNHSKDNVRVGQLLCINGAGSQYNWIRQNIALDGMTYGDLESRINNIGVGSDELRIHPFGNGAERMLENVQLGSSITNINFNIHSRDHIYRAALEGIAFAFAYGVEIMERVGVMPKKMKVGNDNLFQSQVFSETIATIIDCEIEMMSTTGAIGAAQASGVAIGAFSSLSEAVSAVKMIETYTPNLNNAEYMDAYSDWKAVLNSKLENKV